MTSQTSFCYANSRSKGAAFSQKELWYLIHYISAGVTVGTETDLGFSTNSVEDFLFLFSQHKFDIVCQWIKFPLNCFVITQYGLLQ